MPTHSPNNGYPASLLDDALRYYARGWTIIPARGKKAAGRWKKCQTTRPDEDELRRLFQQVSVTGFAVLLGSASGGLACRDFDDLAGYECWAAEHAPLAASLPTVETHRGRHVYFRGPELFVDFGDGEYRGDSGHYCLLPPSRHPSGHIYRWLNPLPTGALPEIDPYEAGMIPGGTQQTQAVMVNGAVSAVSSAPAVFPASAVSSAPAVFHQEVEDAISSTLPTRERKRNRRIFDFARKLKAIPSLATADFAALRPLVREWHRRALPVIGTKEFSETWSDFIAAREGVQFAAGQGPIDAAFQHAAQGQPSRKALELYGDEPKIVLLAGLCRELQRIVGDDAFFFLDCRTAGGLLEVTHKKAWRWLNMLCADGILAAGEKGSLATHKANTYRYVAVD